MVICIFSFYLNDIEDNFVYYTVARRYEHKIHIFELTCNVLFII